MNLKINIALFLAFSTFAICIFLLVKRNGETKPETQREENDQEEAVAETPEPSIEIAHFMNRIQVFHNKLYFAGINGNTELALFYLDEMEEEMGVIAEAGVFELDANISENIVTYGLKRVETMRKQLKTDPKTFASDFEQLTTSCNSCHVISQKAFVKIIIPTSPIFSNQEYKPGL